MRQNLFNQLAELSDIMLGGSAIFRDGKVYSVGTPSNYPPTNLIKLSDDEFVYELAVAGFKKAELKVTKERNVLTVTGEREQTSEQTFYARGIATRKFKWQRAIHEFMEVQSVKLEDGILRIALKMNVPEKDKPIELNID